jgi:hypothetical protein
MELIDKFSVTISQSPWMVGTIVLCFAVSLFIVKVTPSIISILQTVFDTKTTLEIKEVVQDIRTSQKARYTQIDEMNAKTDQRLGCLEEGVTGLKRDVENIYQRLG